MTYKIRLNTDEAQAAERRLMKKKGRARVMAERAARKTRIPLTQMALGAAAAFSFSSRFRRNTINNVDPWTQANIPLAATIHWWTNKLRGGSLAASQRARKDSAQRFAAVPDEEQRRATSRAYFTFAEQAFTLEEQGRNVVRMSVKQPTPRELLDRATAGYVELLDKSIDWVMGVPE